MTVRPLGDSELDAAIDRAVRDLMGAEPRADLRERVLSELAGTSTRATLWPRFAFGLAAAAVAVMIAVQVVQRPSAPPAEQTAGAMPAPSQSPGTDSQAPLAPRLAPSVSSRVLRVNGSPAPTPLRNTIIDPPVQAASIETAEPLGIAPLTPLAQLNSIEPIAPTRLDASQIPAPAIEIKLLAIEPMEIAPLTPRR